MSDLHDGSPRVVRRNHVAVGALEVVHHELDRERLLQDHAAVDLFLHCQLHLDDGGSKIGRNSPSEEKLAPSACENGALSK